MNLDNMRELFHALRGVRLELEMAVRDYGSTDAVENILTSLNTEIARLEPLCNLRPLHEVMKQFREDQTGGDNISD